ncbi:MAG: rhamnulokinase [Anaerolineae bacterium]|nr:rhamnulokinase [Anaerolineae bacterium]
MSKQHVISVDLGASSGRVMEVSFDGQRFDQIEAHRFPNTPVEVRGTLYWDVLRLWHEITAGINKVTSGAMSVGVDTWGVDFGLLDAQGKLIANPVHYRDARTDGMFDWIFERVPRRTVFERTGIQFQFFNTSLQLASLVRDQSPWLDRAETLLLMPDLIEYWLSGEKSCEFTNVTTTQIFNPHTQNWDYETLHALGVPTAMLPQIVPAGTVKGEYQGDSSGMKVIAPATHDTGSAVVAVPTTTKNYAYLSSGTWSLIGLELPEPVITDASYANNVTNEGGVYGTYRFLKNVAGLWLSQQCEATWKAEGADYSYQELTAKAQEAEPFRSLLDPDDDLFIAPGDMPARIRAYCRRTSQPEPETVGQTMRAIYESLALKYRLSLDCMSELSGRSIDRLHIIGGGARNALLNQMAADCLNREVVAGPYEATALGNAIVQFITLGIIDDVAQARDILSKSIETVHYEPQPSAAWDDAYGRYQALVEG